MVEANKAKTDADRYLDADSQGNSASAEADKAEASKVNVDKSTSQATEETKTMPVDNVTSSVNITSELNQENVFVKGSETTSTKVTAKKQTELPQTGEDTDLSNLAGLGLISASLLGLFGFGKKRRKEDR